VQTRHWPRSGPFVSWPVSCCVDRTSTSFWSLRIVTFIICVSILNHRFCGLPTKHQRWTTFRSTLIVLWEIIGVSSYINVDCRLVCFRVQRILVLQDVDWQNDVELIYWFGVFVVIHTLCSCVEEWLTFSATVFLTCRFSGIFSKCTWFIQLLYWFFFHFFHRDPAEIIKVII